MCLLTVAARAPFVSLICASQPSVTDTQSCMLLHPVHDASLLFISPELVSCLVSGIYAQFANDKRQSYGLKWYSSSISIVLEVEEYWRSHNSVSVHPPLSANAMQGVLLASLLHMQDWQIFRTDFCLNWLMIGNYSLDLRSLSHQEQDHFSQR